MPGPSIFGPYGGKTKRAFYESLLVALKTERNPFDQRWQELAKYVMPTRVRFVSTNRNRDAIRRDQAIINNTASLAARTLESGLHAGLTSPARPWFKLGTPDPDLAEFGPVKEWLHEVTTRMATRFSQSNLYNGLPTVYGDLGTFATGAMSILPDSRDLFRATTYPLGSYAVGTDSRGLVNLFLHEYELTVFQVVEQFGGENGQRAEYGRPIQWQNISHAVRNAWDNGHYELPVQILWVVSSNPEQVPGSPFSRHMAFQSCYFEQGAGGSRRQLGGESSEDISKVLRTSGFRTFPVLVPRWAVTGNDSYGTDSPGFKCIGDVKQLQTMERKGNQAIAKGVDPPLVGPVSLMTQKTSLLPGDVTYVDTREGQQGLRSIHDVSLNIEHLIFKGKDVEQRIDRAYFADLFLMLARSDYQRGTQPPTAREIEERHEEKLLALGPVLERTNDELLDPLIDRVYSMMEDEGDLPPIPRELDQVRLKVEYISVMAQAQKLIGVVGQDRFLMTVSPLLGVIPDVQRKVRWSRLIDNYGDMLGIDPRAIVPTEEAERAMQEDARQQQLAMAAEVAAKGAQAAKLASETRTDQGNTALSQIAPAVGLGV